MIEPIMISANEKPVEKLSDVIIMINDLGIEPDTIQRTRECAKCGYNLYSLPREGSCPECGHPYKSRKNDAIAKNPRRQLAQLNRMRERYERDLRSMPLWWLASGIAVVACLVLGAGKWWWILAGGVTLVTAARHEIAVLNRSEVKRKIEAIDAQRPQR
jgi:ribosomal protein L37E